MPHARLRVCLSPRLGFLTFIRVGAISPSRLHTPRNVPLCACVSVHVCVCARPCARALGRSPGPAVVGGGHPHAVPSEARVRPCRRARGSGQLAAPPALRGPQRRRAQRWRSSGSFAGFRLVRGCTQGNLGCAPRRPRPRTAFVHMRRHGVEHGAR